jgi:hypothetical protein
LYAISKDVSIFIRNLKGRGNLEDLDVDRTSVLSENRNLHCGTASAGSGEGPVLECCE